MTGLTGENLVTAIATRKETRAGRYTEEIAPRLAMLVEQYRLANKEEPSLKTFKVLEQRAIYEQDRKLAHMRNITLDWWKSGYKDNEYRLVAEILADRLAKIEGRWVEKHIKEHKAPPETAIYGSIAYRELQAHLNLDTSIKQAPPPIDKLVPRDSQDIHQQQLFQYFEQFEKFPTRMLGKALEANCQQLASLGQNSVSLEQYKDVSPKVASMINAYKTSKLHQELFRQAIAKQTAPTSSDMKRAEDKAVAQTNKMFNEQVLQKQKDMSKDRGMDM
jgi:hypothetical protein